MKILDIIKAKISNYLINRLALQKSQDRYEHLLELFKTHNPTSMIEIGVWRGDRAVCFLTEGRKLQKYVGFDLFEDISDEKFQQESMGLCFPSMKQEILQRITPLAKRNGCQVVLVPGLTEDTLPRFSKDNADKFDFIYIDGGHSIETIANDWNYAKELVASNGLIVFDDYYLNDGTRGAKLLVDELLNNPDYRVRFFPIVENIIEDLQITMVAVWPQSPPL